MTPGAGRASGGSGSRGSAARNPPMRGRAGRKLRCRGLWPVAASVAGQRRRWPSPDVGGRRYPRCSGRAWTGTRSARGQCCALKRRLGPPPVSPRSAAWPFRGFPGSPGPSFWEPRDPRFCLSLQDPCAERPRGTVLAAPSRDGAFSLPGEWASSAPPPRSSGRPGPAPWLCPRGP